MTMHFIRLKFQNLSILTLKGCIIMIEIYVDGGLKDCHMYVGIISTSDNCPIKFSKRLRFGPSHKSEEEAIHYCIKIIKKLRKPTLRLKKSKTTLALPALM